MVLVSLTYCVHQVLVTFDGVRPTNHEDGHGIGFADVLEEATLSKKVPGAGAVARGDLELQPSGTSEHPEHRQLKFRTALVHFWRVRRHSTHTFRITITNSLGPVFTQLLYFTTASRTHASLFLSLDDSFLNDDKSNVCDTCTLEAEEVGCDPERGCDEDVEAKVSAAEKCSQL